MNEKKENEEINLINKEDFPVYKDLENKTVFITGGGSGIGAYITAAFAMQKANVAFVSMREKPANELIEIIVRKGCKPPLFYKADIRDIKKLSEAINNTREKLGSIDILVNNAARDTRHTVESLTVDQWDDMLNTNLRPYFFSAQYVVEGMKKKHAGNIINLGSNCPILGLSGYPAYVASKAASTGLTKALARELGSYNIRVNSLIPGWVMTKRQKELWVTDENLKELLESQSLKSTIDGIHIAQFALFMSSDASAMMTGQSVIVDGGRS